MSTHAQHQHDKVRLTVECSLDERTFIKMLAAKKPAIPAGNRYALKTISPVYFKIKFVGLLAY